MKTPLAQLLLLLMASPWKGILAATIATTIVDTTVQTTINATTVNAIVRDAPTVAAPEERGPVLVNKCCPLGQILTLETASSFACVPLQPRDADASGSAPPEEETWQAAWARGRPPWLEGRLAAVLEGAGAASQGGAARVGYAALRGLCPDADRQMVPVGSRSRYRLLPNGHLELRLAAWGGAGVAQLAPADFCVDSVDHAPTAPNGTHVLLACPCRRVLCVRKCCARQRLFAGVADACVTHAPDALAALAPTNTGTAEGTRIAAANGSYTNAGTTGATGATGTTGSPTTSGTARTSGAAGTTETSTSSTTTRNAGNARYAGTLGNDGTSGTAGTTGNGTASGTFVAWKPNFRGPDLAPAQPPATFHLLQQFPQCKPHERLVLLNGASAMPPYRRLWVLGNGSALLEHFGWGRAFAAGRWCGEWRAAGAAGGAQLLEDAVFCMAAGPAPAPPPAGVRTLGALFLLGACFLAMTLCVYALLPELRAPPHAKALMCHSGALLVASVALAAMQLTPVVPDALCDIAAMTIQFSFLAAFFWLNVLCIDISWAFSGVRGLLGGLAEASRRKFVFYSLYAWGCPLLITAATVSLHLLHKRRALPPWVVVPNVGGKECWFYGEAAHWLYFYGPMAALLAANAALFVFTALRLAVAQRDAAKQLQRAGSVRHDRSSRLSQDKRRFILYTKLFLLMGVTWVMEVVSWSARQDKNGTEVEPAWLFTDIINALRGVFIFIIFCCKRKVVLMLRKRLDAWGLPGGPPAGVSSRSRTLRSHTSTRQSSLLQLSPLGGTPRASTIKAPRRPSVQFRVDGAHLKNIKELKALDDPKEPRRASSPLSAFAWKTPRRYSTPVRAVCGASVKDPRRPSAPAAANIAAPKSTPGPTPTQPDVPRRASAPVSTAGPMRSWRRPSVPSFLCFRSRRVVADAESKITPRSGSVPDSSVYSSPATIPMTSPIPASASVEETAPSSDSVRIALPAVTSTLRPPDAAEHDSFQSIPLSSSCISSSIAKYDDHSNLKSVPTSYSQSNSPEAALAENNHANDDSSSLATPEEFATVPLANSPITSTESDEKTNALHFEETTQDALPP